MEHYDLPSILKDENYPTVEEQAIDEYLSSLKQELLQMDSREVRDILLSELNYQERGKLKSCRCFNIYVKEGDICFTDFGKAYNQEIGFMHFALVLKVYNSKAFVIPMTSNSHAFLSAYDKVFNPSGVTHLMRLGKVDGMFKYSVLFLNDAKFINTARIINVRSHIDTDSPLYQRVLERFRSIIQL